MSQVQSFGSNCHPLSQSRKISIGIMVESSAQRRPGSTKEHDIASPTVPVTNCRLKDSTEGAQVTTKEKQTEPLEQGSPWIRTRSNHEQSTTSGTASHAKVIGTRMNAGGMHDEHNRFKAGPSDHSAKFFPKQTSFSQPDNNFLKKTSEGIAHARKVEKCANTQTGDKFPSTTAQEQDSKIGDKDENTVNGTSETLRMKLWELLGTVTSPNKEKHNTPTLEVDGDSLRSEGGGKQPATRTVKPRQNSDTIETDTESPDCANKRPVTRSLARKRAPSKLKQDKLKCGQPSASRQKPGERNIFSFEEGWYVGLKDAANLSPSTGNKRKRTRRKGPQIESCKTAVQRKKNEEKIQRLTDKRQNPLTADKSCSGGSSKESSRHVESHVKGNNIYPRRPTADKDSPKQLTSKPGQQVDIKSPALPDYEDLQEHIVNSSLENAVDPQFNAESLHTQRKSLGIDNHITSIQPINKHGIGHLTDKSKNATPAEKSCSHGSSGSNANGRSLCSTHSNIKRNDIDPRRGNIENDFLGHPVTHKPDQQEDTNSPTLPGHLSQRGEGIGSPTLPGQQSRIGEDIGSPTLPEKHSQRGYNSNPSFKYFLDPQDGAESPTFGKRSPIASHSLGSRHKETTVHQKANNPAEPKCLSTEGGIFSFGMFTSKLFPNRNDGDELQHSPPRSPIPPTQENDAENTSSEDTGSESIEDGPGAETFSPEIGTDEKPRFMLHRTKRLGSFEDLQYQERIPARVSPKVTRENNSMQEPEEQNVGEKEEEEEEVEDGMTRAIAMLALALEKLKSKVKLLTSKKSSIILTSVAERIHAQLHNVESQIQTDTCKLTSLSKQKRKRLETEFQEQEEQLKMIHGNFKKEVGRLLEDCKGTIEGLEDNHTELKGIVEKQKASHRKLLIQVQEAVKTQLHDAEKRITAINQSAREQMLQLKLVIAECLEGGILS
ncbi:meiosis-specific protein ASY3 isoform X2 [Punica granatum]|uniref:Meiosis-specific protein ASY3 isoform X2 n=1 Tax=Punica granatum TaxID=22663 RepID=A0A6P8CE28_PUNGR|nr:meiosis-specific protein ASY3 isoform X2 [Punica granatum]